MQLLQPSPPVSGKRNSDKGLKSVRTRKKHKRLDAICEKIYNENHCIDLDANGDSLEMDPSFLHVQLRRSSRVRRAPSLLDSSPPPSKRRKSFAKIGTGSSSPCRTSDDFSTMDQSPGTTPASAEECGRWRSRLRSRVTNGGSKVDNKRSPRGKKKLFKDVVEIHKHATAGGNGLGDNREVLAMGVPTVVKSRRSVVVRATHVQRGGAKKTCFEEQIAQEGDVMTRSIKKAKSCIAEHTSVGPTNCYNTELLSKHSHIGSGDGLQLNNLNPLYVAQGNAKETEDIFVEDSFAGTGNMETVAISDKETKNMDVSAEREVTYTARYLDDRVEHYKPKTGNYIFSEHTEGQTKDKNDQEGKFNHPFIERINNRKISEGRRCGLCGTGTDGKPPKIFYKEPNESENEECSGYPEESNYDIWDGFGDEPDWAGCLLGPVNDRFGIAGVWVHQNCAVWSPEVYFARQGCLKNIKAALCRGRLLKCSRCTRPGATIGCREDRCPKTYHLPCARASGCHFDHRKFLIACSDHHGLFQPHGSQNLTWIKKMKAKKTKLEMRKKSSEACRKDVDDEEKWFENCGEDEEFLRREGRRLNRDLSRIQPVYIGGSNGETDVQFHGWESVAGLQDVIDSMKEVVTLPLLYPQFFDGLGLNPPRGVLLHGHPGTGKTLVVRALIGSCARGDKRIAYFARKGADCLGKYVGDAERQLRLLFQAAERSQPSIIFFDEIDGLAPRRTSRQDQTQSSVVSTLLALLDGLKPRGSVVVIGATNRPDALDPALRRPGRFDREIYFPLPSEEDRAAILSLYTQRWPNPVSVDVINRISMKTSGFSGADLKSLCAQAAMISLKRNHPMHDLLSPSGRNRPYIPTFLMTERDWLEALADSPPPCCLREAGIILSNAVSSPLHVHLIPSLLHPLSLLLVALSFDERLTLPQPLLKVVACIKSLLCADMEKKKAPNHHWPSHIYDLLQEEENVAQIKNVITRRSTSTGGADVSDFVENIKPSLINGSAFRILIAGKIRSGQRHIASCILHHLSGSVGIQRLDLATLSQEGLDDLAHAISQILMRCASSGSPFLLFMPRIDLWVVEKSPSVDDTDRDYYPSEGSSTSREGENDFSCPGEPSSSIDVVSPTPSAKASLLWSTFIEQVTSLAASTPLFILATSGIPNTALPPTVKQFFRSDMLDLTSLPLSLDPVPGFILDLKGAFDHTGLMDRAATELTRDMVRLFVELVHVETGLKTTADAPESVGEDRRPGGGTVEAGLSRNEPPLDVPPRGKSTLTCAISAFGYQVLSHPYFAELCWVTSKLKAGPSTHIDGPSKRWLFNSCVVRPDRLEGGVRGKADSESSLVRGLVAIGLSAYRGAYASPVEASGEVRKVLELLVDCVNRKIRSGKSWHRYSRMLSQAACLEDMVDGWVHTLRSLGHDVEEAASVNMKDCEPRGGHRQGPPSSVSSELQKPPSSSPGITPPGEEDDSCTYSCCGECFVALRGLVLKLVVEGWGAGGRSGGIDGGHDTVASVGVGLLSDVRKLCEGRRGPAGEAGEGCRVYIHRGKRKNWCRCSCLEKETVGPRECWCHSGRSRPFYGPENPFLLVRNGIASAGSGGSSPRGMVLCLCSLVECLSSRWRKRRESR